MQPLPYVKRQKMSRAKIARPDPASPVPTDLIGIAAGSKLDPDLSEGQIRLWVNRGQLPSYRNPVPGAGRRPGRGRSIQRWISEAELRAFVASRKKAEGGDPITDTGVAS